ncbi:MAG: hypothetical protein EZS28_051925, partial [Streblomastix strix]
MNPGLKVNQGKQMTSYQVKPINNRRMDQITKLIQELESTQQNSQMLQDQKKLTSRPVNKHILIQVGVQEVIQNPDLQQIDKTRQLNSSQDLQGINNIQHIPASEIIPIGGRLIHFIRVWQQIGADQLIQRGIKAYWIHPECPEILRKNKQRFNQTRSEDGLQALDQLINQEVQEQIVEKQPWQMEKDNRLLDSEQISKNKPFYNGEYQYSKRDLVTQRLDDKDRSTICLPSYPCGSRVQTVSGVLPQESVLSIQSNVLWGKTCTTNIPQDVET